MSPCYFSWKTPLSSFSKLSFKKYITFLEMCYLLTLHFFDKKLLEKITSWSFFWTQCFYRLVAFWSFLERYNVPWKKSSHFHELVTFCWEIVARFCKIVENVDIFLKHNIWLCDHLKKYVFFLIYDFFPLFFQRAFQNILWFEMGVGNFSPRLNCEVSSDAMSRKCWFVSSGRWVHRDQGWRDKTDRFWISRLSELWSILFSKTHSYNLPVVYHPNKNPVDIRFRSPNRRYLRLIQKLARKHL